MEGSVHQPNPFWEPAQKVFCNWGVLKLKWDPALVTEVVTFVGLVQKPFVESWIKLGVHEVNEAEIGRLSIS